MIKMLVVDDEAVIREGIIKSIEWDQYDICIAGEACNGREALKIAYDTKPEIIIVDIRMPVMDGLEFSKRIRELLPSVKLIVLTGFGEFEYAKKAIDLKVSEFILKPAGAEELIRIITRLRDEIIYEKKKEETGKSYELLMNENLPVLQGRVVNRLVNAAMSSDERDEFIDAVGKLDMNLPGPRFQIFILAIDDYYFSILSKSPKNRELTLESVLDISREAMDSYTNGYIFRNEIGLFVGLVNSGHHTCNISAMCKNIQYLISRHLKLSVSIGIGNEKSDIFTVYESYNEAFNALRVRFYKGKSLVIGIDELKAGDSALTQISLQSCTEEEKELLLCLRLIDRNGVSSLLDRLFERFMTVNADYSNIKNISLNLIMSSIRELQDMGIDTQEHMEVRFDPFQEIEKYETAEDIKKWMMKLIGELITIIENEKNESYKGIVKIAIEYMMKHYYEPISLAAIAESVHVTPNYFSRVFRKETGESFVEWLNKYRVEKAKELLNDRSLKTYEVAEKVGFNDYKHFSYNFKKYMNCSLTEYKEQRLKG